MKKNLLYTALGLMGLMGTLAIGVVNAETTISEPYGHIDYMLNENEPFEAKVITITDGTDTITILDRNLGAKKAGTGCEEPNVYGGDACAGGDDTYGYHFQRGNNYGFNPTDETIQTNAKSVSSDGAEWDDSGSYNNSGYYGSTFIKGDSSHGYDYWKDSTSSSSNHENLRGGGGDYNDASNGFGKNNENRRGPCPEGFHVPSIGELSKLVSMMTGSNNSEKVTQLHNNLYIPFAGLRNAYYAFVDTMGLYAYLWSSSPTSVANPYSRDLILRVYGDLYQGIDDRANGLSVRCFYDFYQPFTQSFTLTFDVSDDNGSTSAETGAVASGTVVALNTGDFVATKDGWTHLGWNTDASATGVLESITMTEDTTVYAIFSKDLTVNYATGTGVSTLQKESDSCSMYNTGTSCTLTVPDITEDEGYENGVWKKGDDTVNPGEDITLTSDGDIYAATASAKEFAIRFVDSNQQNVDVIYSGAYKSGTSNITYPSWTRDGYSISWDKSIPATMPLNGETITANWTENAKPSGGYSGGGGRSRNSNTQDSSTSSQNDSNVSSGANAKDPGSVTPMDSSDKSSEGQYSDEFQQAYEFAYKNGITTMDTIQRADMEGSLTRIAMAKMLSQYAINVLGKSPANVVVPNFKDVTKKLDEEYDNGVTLAYQLGIMGQNMPNNKFRPNDEVTRAEFATALSRMLYQTSDGEYKSTDKYYTNHIEKLVSEGIITNDNPTMKELRGYVMIMLMRSTK